LAVTADGTRAAVIAADGTVADVNLATLTVSYHSPAAPVSLFGQLRDWLEPAAQAKGFDGATRQACWVSDHGLAISGEDGHAFIDAQGRIEGDTTPAGLKLLDTNSWSIRTIDNQTSAFLLGSSLLLASSDQWNWQTGRANANGLTAYSLQGEQIFHLFGNQPVGSIQVAGGRGYLSPGNRQTDVIDLQTGRSSEIKGQMPWLITASQPCA
jgi:hypothetical protein